MKLLAAVIIVVLTIGTTQAQNMGIKGGVNIATLHPEVPGQDSRIGFHAGLLWHIHLGQQLAFQPEIVYSLQGERYSDNSKLNLGYINAPFLLQVMVGNGFRFEAGPQFGFLIHARSQAGNNYEDVKDSFETIDTSLAIGIGFIGSSGLGFDARYNHGLSDIDKSGEKVTNRVFQLGLFYQFHH